MLMWLYAWWCRVAGRPLVIGWSDDLAAQLGVPHHDYTPAVVPIETFHLLGTLVTYGRNPQYIDVWAHGECCHYIVSSVMDLGSDDMRQHFTLPDGIMDQVNLRCLHRQYGDEL